MRTIDYVNLLVYGGSGAAAVGRRLRAMHKGFQGVREDGERYYALEPEAYAWVHATLLETYVAGHAHFGRPMRRDQIDRFYREYRGLGRLVGVREHDLPPDWPSRAGRRETPPPEARVPAQTARLLALAFDPEVRSVQDELSGRILDAALALAAASGLRHLTMDDVAQRAGVGRMTVYRRFGSREALVQALSVRECRRCLSVISASLDPELPVDERLASLFTATLGVIREHPLLERLARVEPQALLSELTRDDSAVFRMVRAFLVQLIGEGQASGELLPGDPGLLAELWLRLGASFVLMPDSVLPPADEEATRAAVRRLPKPIVRGIGRTPTRQAMHVA